MASDTVYGWVGIRPQMQKLKQADISLACLGRLLDHIGRRTLDVSRLEVLVLDECSDMFPSEGKFPFSSLTLTRILHCESPSTSLTTGKHFTSSPRDPIMPPFIG
ncbi:MAG: DEAD/DEAH box helicase [Thermodesulfobacteriota bacterium]|nr:DEAD/DEAH box helicase [Thermodesulfobacteriota bacterium]